MGALGARTVRAVTHLDISRDDIQRTLTAARQVFHG
jgi:hypothetical protein